MIKFLPFILIPILLIAGLGYWRYNANTTNLNSPKTAEQIQQEPIEIPQTLPEASVEDRVKALEDLATKLATQVNSLKSQSSSSNSTSSDSKIAALEASATELKARVSVLEKGSSTTTTTSSNQSTAYIPLATNGGPWGDKDWYTTTYEISINSANYPNYTGMNLEVIFKLNNKSGTASVRLYNVTDGVGYAQVDTTSDSYSLQTSSSFKIATGTKTYKLQIKSNEGADMLIQSARLKVAF